MTTAVVSDLHLGASSPPSVLRSRRVRARLFERLAAVDRVVLLGDVLELRQAPLPAVLDAARPFFVELGEALGDKQIVVVPGNHDHHLAAWEREHGLLSLDGTAPEPRPPAPDGPLASLAALTGRAELTIAYPGVRLRADIWATHGHYLDCHNSVPALEAVAAAAAARRVKAFGEGGPLTAYDYERALSPLYALAFRQAQWRDRGRSVAPANLSIAIWRALEGPGGRARFARLLGGVVVPVAVGTLNAAGLGPFGTDFSGRALRLASIAGMAEVIERLGIEADHAIFGHTHRTGPLEREAGWSTPQGVRLWNSGCWVYEPSFLGESAPESPYWPGTCVIVEDSGPPKVERLLEDLTHAELAEAVRADGPA
ncbi:MAG: metallophosphoesterase family protein [Thermoleophilaceae bacterium]|nr:metallophosphoesterase family protein [Thermoleophilaceae bacterium]